MLVLYLKLCNSNAPTFSECYFRCGDAFRSRKTRPYNGREMFRRVSLLVTPHLGYSSCLLRETLLSLSWQRQQQPLLRAISQRVVTAQ